MKRLLLPLGCYLALLITVPTLANPLGGSVVGGAGAISGEGTALVTFDQTSARAVINWDSFNLGAADTTRFVFLPAGGAVLNRVNVAGGISTLSGLLESTLGPGGAVGGSVYLINPNGILVGPSGGINVGSFFGSTLDVGPDETTANINFLAGGNFTFQGSSTASVENQGTITALNDVFLIAHTVRNAGTINSRHAGLAAGVQVQLAEVGNERISVVAGTGAATPVGVDNAAAGQINSVITELKAAGGNIYALAINNAGAVRANSVVVENGRVFLRARDSSTGNRGAIASGGTITIAGSVPAADVTLEGTTVALSGNVNAGTGNVTIDNNGALTHAAGTVSATTLTLQGSGDVGDGVAANVLDTAVDNLVLAKIGGNSFITDAGAVNVEGTTGGGNLNLASGGATTVNAALSAGVGSVTFGGAVNVNATVSAASATFNGTAALNVNGTSVQTTGIQTYNSDVNLGANTAVSGSTVQFNGNVVGGNNGLTISGNAVLGDAQGDALSGLTSLAINGDTTLNAGSVTSSGAQNYNGNLTMAGGAKTLTATVVGIDGNLAGGNNGLTISGNAVLGEAQGDTLSGLTTLAINGDTTLDAGSVTSSGAQDYNGNLTLAGGAKALTATTVGVDGNVVGGNNALTISGNAVLGDAQGDTMSGLTTLAINGDTTLNAGAVTSSGAQDYNGNLTLAGGANTLAATAVGIDGNVVGGNNGLTISGNAVLGDAQGDTLSGLTTLAINGDTTLNAGSVTSSGAQDYNGNLTLAGGAKTLTATTVGVDGNVVGGNNGLTISGNAVLGDAQGDTLSGLTTLAVNGDTTLNAGSVTSSGAQDYNGNMTLAGGAKTLTATTVGIDGNVVGGNNGLTISGNAVLGDAQGDTLSGLTTLAINGDTTLNAGSVTSSGAQDYNGNLTLAGGAKTLTATAVGIDGNVVGGNNGLTISGNAVLGDAQGDALSGLTTLAINGDTTLNAGAVTSSGAQDYNGNLTLAGGTKTLTAATVGVDGNVVGGNNGLTISGNAVLGDAQGDTLNGLTTLTVNGTTTLNAGSVTTSGSQTYNGSFTLAADSILNGVGITFTSTVDRDGVAARDLTVSAGGGPLTFAGNVGAGPNGALGTLAANSGGAAVFGGTVNAASLATDAGGTTALNGGSVTTSGNQTYGDAVILGNAAVLSSTAGNLVFNNALNAGAFNLTLSADEIDFGGGAASVSGTGSLLLQPQLDTTSIGIAGGAGTLDLSLADVAALANGFSSITIGRVLGQHQINVNAVTFLDPVNIRSPVGGGITVNGLITGTGNASVMLDGSGATTVLNAGITTAGENITISDNVVLGNSVVLNTGAGPGDILITGTIEGTTDSAQNLGLTAGTGSIQLQGNVGGNVRLGQLAINSANNVTLAGLRVASLQQFAGSGATTLGGLVDANGAGGVALNGNNFTVGGGITLAGAGTTVRFNNSGSVSGAGIITAPTLNLEGNGNVGLSALNPLNTSVNAITLNKAGGSVFLAESSDVAISGNTAGNLDLAAGGPVSQSLALIVGGSTAIRAGANNITLNNAGNDFNSLIVEGGVVIVTDQNALTIGGTATSLGVNAGATTLSAATIGAGGLNVTASGAIAQSGAVTVSGGTTFNAGANTITLNNAANDFSSVLVQGGTVSVSDQNALTIGGTANALSVNAGATTLSASTIGVGGLNVTAGGAISQSGALIVGGASTLNAGANSITLNNAANDFSSVVVQGGTVNVGDQDALTIGGTANSLAVNAGATTLSASTIGAGGLTVNADGAISQSGAVTVGGGTTLSAGANNITLNNAANDFNSVTVQGGVVTVSDQNALTIGGTANSLAVDAGATTLSASTIGAGGLTVNAGGAISQSDAVTVGGSTTLNAGANDITLNNAANDFSTVLVQGGVVNVSDQNALTIGGTATSLGVNAGATTLSASTIGAGGVNVIASGAINQSGALTVAGASVLNAGANNITLTDAGNDFSSVAVQGGPVSIVDQNALTVGGTATSLGVNAGATTLSASTIGAGGLNIAASGAISQSGAVTVAGGTTLNAGANNITLNDAANDFSSVAVQGGTVNVSDQNALTIGGTATSLGVNAGATTLSASTIGAGGLNVTAGGAISQSGTLTVGGGSILNAGANNITLADAANDFTTVTVQGGVVSIVDQSALTVGGTASSMAVTAGATTLTTSTIGAGGLDVTAGGAIDQSGAVIVSGGTTLNAGGNNITLNNGANDFSSVEVQGGVVNVTDQNALTIGGTATSLGINAGATTLSASSIGAGGLSVTASGVIAQSGAVTVIGATTLNAGANDIVLNNGANDFSSVVVQGGAVSVSDQNALTIGGTANALAVNAGATTLSASTIGAGGLSVIASGVIAQSGVVSVSGATTLDAGANNITLNNAANDFDSVTVQQGGAVDVSDQNALTIGGTANSLAVNAGATTLSASTIGVGGLTVNAGGAINQSGAVIANGNAAFTAIGGSSILLGNAGNQFNGTVSFASSTPGVNLLNVTVADTTAFDLQALALDGNLDVSAGGAISQSGALTIVGVSTLNAGADSITLNNAANDFNSVTVQGGAVSVTDLNALTIGTGGGSANSLTINAGATTLAASTIGAGGLNATAGGGIGQSGAVMVAGNTTLNAGVNSITLNNAGNDFSSVTIDSAGNATLRDASALQLGTVTLAGQLGLVSEGDITQVGAITVTDLSVDAGSGIAILLNSANKIANANANFGNFIEIPDDPIVDEFRIFDSSSATLYTDEASQGVQDAIQRLILFYAPQVELAERERAIEFEGTALPLPGLYLRSAEVNLDGIVTRSAQVLPQ